MSLAVVSAFALSWGACSKEKKALAEIREAFENGEYRETIALCRYAIRRKMGSSAVYYHYGASLVSIDRDFEGFNELKEAVRLDPSAVPMVSEFLFAAGVESFEKGQKPQAARRLRQAAEIDASLNLGVYRFLVADSFLEAKEYEKAAHLYEEAIRAYPDSSVVEESYLNMANAHAESKTYRRAIETLEQMLTLYPRGKFTTQARWRLVNLLYEESEKHYVLGNFDEVVELVTELIDKTSNPGLIQKSRFLLGETYEALGEIDKAFEQYRLVIRGDRGASGRIVERAREKIAAFKEAGLY